MFEHLSAKHRVIGTFKGGYCIQRASKSVLRYRSTVKFFRSAKIAGFVPAVTEVRGIRVLPGAHVEQSALRFNR